MKIKKPLKMLLCLACSIPTLSVASMNVIRNHSGEVIAVNPWSYLNEEIMWSAVYSSNPDGGKINGYLNARYNVQFDRVQSDAHKVNENITFVKGVFRSQDLPGWYLGIYSDRDTELQGPYGRYKFAGSQLKSELVVGKEFSYDRIKFGGDVMGGYQSTGFEYDQGKLSDWNARLKLYTEIAVYEKLSLFGYVYHQWDRRRHRSIENDRDGRTTAFEPGFQYIINNNNGVWIRSKFYFYRLERQEWGNIKDKYNVTSIGYWNIWQKLQTSISFGIQSENKYDADPRYSETFYDAHSNYIQLNATYPLNDRFILSGEIKRTHLNQSGTWTEDAKGNLYDCALMIEFNF